MKNIKKRALSIFLAMIFLILPLQIAAVNAEEIETNETLVNVVVTDSDGLTIVAQVPETYVEEYESMLENPEFKQEQIEEAQSGLIQTRILPDGKIISQRSMFRTDIVNKYKQVVSPNFERDLIVKGVDFVLGKMISKLGGIWGFAYDLLTSAIDMVRVKPEDWWYDSYVMIINREISCVRESLIENVKPTYPASWLIYERLK